MRNCGSTNHFFHFSRCSQIWSWPVSSVSLSVSKQNVFDTRQNLHLENMEFSPAKRGTRTKSWLERATNLTKVTTDEPKLWVLLVPNDLKESAFYWNSFVESLWCLGLKSSEWVVPLGGTANVLPWNNKLTAETAQDKILTLTFYIGTKKNPN